MRRFLVGLLPCLLAAACAAAPPPQTPSPVPEPGTVNAVDDSTAAPAPSAQEPDAVESASQPEEIAEITKAQPSTEASAPVSEPEPVGDVPGANLHVSRVTTNGVTIENVDCRSEGGGVGGLLGSLVIGKPFADRKGQLDRCVQGPHKTRVRWTSSAGKMRDVKVVSGDDPANPCIERALDGAMAPLAGDCAASVEIGK